VAAAATTDEMRAPRAPRDPPALTPAPPAKRLRYDEPTMLAAAQTLWTHATRPLLLLLLARCPPTSDALVALYERVAWLDAWAHWPDEASLPPRAAFRDVVARHAPNIDAPQVAGDALWRVRDVYVGRLQPHAAKTADKYYTTLVGLTRLAGELLH
jgi:hypothetical protein